MRTDAVDGLLALLLLVSVVLMAAGGDASMLPALAGFVLVAVRTARQRRASLGRRGSFLALAGAGALALVAWPFAAFLLFPVAGFLLTGLLDDLSLRAVRRAGALARRPLLVLAAGSAPAVALFVAARFAPTVDLAEQLRTAGALGGFVATLVLAAGALRRLAFRAGRADPGLVWRGTLRWMLFAWLFVGQLALVFHEPQGATRPGVVDAQGIRTLIAVVFVVRVFEDLVELPQRLAAKWSALRGIGARNLFFLTTFALALLAAPDIASNDLVEGAESMANISFLLAALVIPLRDAWRALRRLPAREPETEAEGRPGASVLLFLGVAAATVDSADPAVASAMRLVAAFALLAGFGLCVGRAIAASPRVPASAREVVPGVAALLAMSVATAPGRSAVSQAIVLCAVCLVAGLFAGSFLGRVGGALAPPGQLRGWRIVAALPLAVLAAITALSFALDGAARIGAMADVSSWTLAFAGVTIGLLVLGRAVQGLPRLRGQGSLLAFGRVTLVVATLVWLVGAFAVAPGEGLLVGLALGLLPFVELAMLLTDPTHGVLPREAMRDLYLAGVFGALFVLAGSTLAGSASVLDDPPGWVVAATPACVVAGLLVYAFVERRRLAPGVHANALIAARADS